MIRRSAKTGFHPRNRFRGGYDFRASRSVVRPCEGSCGPTSTATTPSTSPNPAAVKALNAALLSSAYGIRGCDLPPGALCPGVPGRSDQIHHDADLLAESARGSIPRGPSVRVLDLCTGASCILPLVGSAEPMAGASSPRMRTQVAALGATEREREHDGRLQHRLPSPTLAALKCFRGIVREGERFDAVTCNPPFYASAAEAEAATRRKLRNLRGGASTARRNFGGRAGELWCEGGELGFVQRMIRESADMRTPSSGSPRWCRAARTSLALQLALRAARATDVRVIPLTHGQKRTRLLAWSFLSVEQRRDWRVV